MIKKKVISERTAAQISSRAPLESLARVTKYTSEKKATVEACL